VSVGSRRFVVEIRAVFEAAGIPVAGARA